MAELELRDLTIQPRGAMAIGPLNLLAESGSVTAALAHDGLTLKGIADALSDGSTRRSGSVTLNDEQLSPSKGQKGIAVSSGLLPKPSRHTVEKVLASAVKAEKVPAKDRDTALAKALTAFDLEPKRDSRTDELSEGELAKLSLALSLATQPACIVLEQPFQHVSQHLRPGLRLALVEAAQRIDIPFLLLTTDVNEALMTAASLAVVHGATVAQQDAPMAVFKRPVNRWVAELMGETNLIEGKLLRSGAGFALVETPAGQFTAALHNGFEPVQGDSITLMIRPEVLRIERIPADENSLEGEIERVDYFGSIARYWFRAGSLLLKINELNPRFATAPSQTLYVFADPDDVVALPSP